MRLCRRNMGEWKMRLSQTPPLAASPHLFAVNYLGDSAKPLLSTIVAHGTTHSCLQWLPHRLALNWFLFSHGNDSKIARANTRKQEPQTGGGSMRKASMKETRSSSSFKPAISIADDKSHKQTSTILRQPDSKADAWEKAQIAKIRKRYENLHNNIKAWENEKKLGEKHHIERKKGDLELRKSSSFKHYYNKIARIDHIA